MLRARRRSRVPARRASTTDISPYIEYVVSCASEQRHASEEGGALTAAARLVALIHQRPLRVGRRVRITLWDAPTDKHIAAAQSATEVHGLRLTQFGKEPKAFIVESLVAGEEVIHLLAS